MIYLTGDTHGEIRRFSSKNFPLGNSLTKDDYIIILGDCGLFWDDSSFDYYWLDWLNEKPWTTLFLDGNHENFNLLNKLPTKEFCGGEVGIARDSILHLKRGQVFEIGGKSFFVMGGAESIDKMYRERNKSWWAQELLSDEDIERGWASLENYSYKIDYVLTHTCPTSKIPEVEKFNDPVSMFLEDISVVIDFKHWYFGHFHINKSLSEKFTCLYERIIPLGTLLND